MIVLSICQPSMIRKIEIIMASPGIIWITRSATMNDLRPLNEKRVIASEARKPRIIETTSVMSVTVIELTIAGGSGARRSSVHTFT